MVIVTIMLRLTDGSRVRRRFLRSDTMGKVLDWADVQGVDLEAQQLSSSLPKVCGKEDLLRVRKTPTDRVSNRMSLVQVLYNSI